MEATPIITYIILAITCFVSYKAFEDHELKRNFLFNGYFIKHKREHYRFLSHGIIHADWLHLGFNMYVLYNFGTIVEPAFMTLFGETQGELYFVLLYVGGLIVSSIYSYLKHQDNIHYNSLGASGAVSGVLYACIAIFPTAEFTVLIIPRVPAWIFGIIYLLYSNYMAKKGMDNIGHDAHFYGAVYGLVLPFILKPELIDNFIFQISDQF